eukprot:NODE_5619_length_656_cov_23.917628_g5236_i0.p1 GENE.NODE_5619_length_656_cov_23.917628_g5236_i0~~NODE_5619_length_656_cov_23.917628_g5236_i0.p1  ORF type:complete len:121 (+),score=30.82 NODE_5619_length_656_cov_23.917628_g5236_i0:104-466(+)
MIDEEEETQEQIERKKKKALRPDRKIQVRVCDMEEGRKNEVIEFAQMGMDDHKFNKDIAAFVKRQCDEKYGGTWHCISGNHFGCNVTHDANTLVNFYIDKIAYLVFRSGPPEKSDEHRTT